MKYLAPAALLLLLGMSEAGTELFDPDREHSWNRLHAHFHSRTTRDGQRYAEEGLQPVFVRESRFLTAGPSHAKALALLDRFLENQEKGLIRDPLKRAILQRDLWAVFGMTADPSLKRQRERRELQQRLVQVMRRIALSPDEINQLPDNLAAAVESRTFPEAYDSAHPERAFLPGGFLDPAGPWVMLGERWGWKGNYLAAPRHAKAINGRSVFLIFLRLPGGRQATEAYLKKLERVRIDREEVPEIPPGTEVALLRRTMLFDKTGRLRLTPITESLQIRVYDDVRKPEMYEFTLRRKNLFAGRAGGLHSVAADEINHFDIASVVLEPGAEKDPFETERQPGNNRPAPVVMKSCSSCHGPGIHGFQSMFLQHYTHPALTAIENLDDQVRVTIEEAEKSYAWGLLQGLWEADSPR